MARQRLKGTKETTPGVFPGSPAAGTQIAIRLVGDDAYPTRFQPNVVTIRDAAGSNRNVAALFGTRRTTGSLNTLLWYPYAKLLLPWGMNLVADGEDFKPAYTMAYDFAEQMEDAGRTMRYYRHLGNYCDTMTVRGTNSGDGIKVTVSATMVALAEATITVADFAAPTLADYPAGDPAIFEDIAGLLSYGGAVTSVRSFEVMVKNKLAVLYDESETPQDVKWCGRDVTWKAELRHKTNAHRVAFDAVTKRSASLALSNGTDTITFDFKTSNALSALTDKLPLGDAHYQTLDSMVLVDSTSATDLIVTVAP